MTGATVQRVAAVLLVAGALACPGGAADAPSSSNGAQLGVTLTTDRPVYAPADEIRMELRVFNRTDRAVDLEFSDGQRYDFVLADEDGDEVWRWSDGRGFIQALGTETLGPGRDSLVFRERHPEELPAGAYRLTGVLTSSSHPMSASVTVRVEP